VRRHAVRAAVVIHTSDTVSAVVAAKAGVLPRRAAATAITISAFNVALAVLANRKD
jgi:hypothetical protein